MLEYAFIPRLDRGIQYFYLGPLLYGGVWIARQAGQ
jgi:hypothetical protein